MRIKEVRTTANVAWSPRANHPVMLAAGTAAQQLDASFDTSSALEVFRLDLADGVSEMPRVVSLEMDSRFHSLVWGPGGDCGRMVGGFDRGTVKVFDASKLLDGSDDAVLFSRDKHSGPVASLDINPFQNNLLASGAGDSEIFIWDLAKQSMPMTPGAKTLPAEDVKAVAWNRQVQHILASASPSKCVVWDLRKNEPIIKVGDSAASARMRFKVVAWHPEVATQLCLASEDDHSPVIQMWDLRLASSPLKTFESHERGVLDLSWCPDDADMLLSCGKDNRILCWNPNSPAEGGEVLGELASSGQWSFGVDFCPRNPAVVAGSSFDGIVSVYSLMGGHDEPAASAHTSAMATIADSFPGMEPIQLPAGPAAGNPAAAKSCQLKRPPRWMKRPCGASFGFGGKLVAFDKSSRAVTVRNVVTDEAVVARSTRLETSLENGNMAEFCDLKASGADNAEVWRFIRANFDEDPRTSFLQLLGYDPHNVRNEIAGKTSRPANQLDCRASDRIDELTDDLKDLKADDEDAFEAIAAKVATDAKANEPFDIDTGEAGLISRALLTGNLELAVDICLEQNRMSDALVLAMHGDNDLLRRTQNTYLEKNTSKELPLIRAVVSGEWTDVVDRLDPRKNWKEALVAGLTHAPYGQLGDPCSRLGRRLLEAGMLEEALVCFVCARDLDNVVKCWMDTRETGTSAELQDMVEVVMALKVAAERTEAVELGTGPLAAQLTRYASILAAQGALAAALNYLGQAKEGPASNLRDRLVGALRWQPMPKRPSWRAREGSLGSTGGPPYTAYANNPAGEDLTRFPPQPMPHLDNGGITQRRNSRPVPDQYQYRNQFQPAPGNYQQPPPIPPSQHHQHPGVNIFTPDYSTPAHPPASAPLGGEYMPPASDGPGWNDPPPAALAMAKSKMAAKTETVASQMSQPITQPLAGVPEVAGQQNVPSSGAQYGYQPASDGYHNFHPHQQQQQPPPPAFNNGYAGYQPQSQQPHQQQYQPQPPPKQPEPALPVPKGPIPAEHVVLQQAFDGLRDRCLAAATHPQIKRKLSDVSKKLDVLYDKLREQTLAPATLAGLHEMTQLIWAYDYNGCLQVVNQLVSGGSFAMLAEFLPGIKVLIQVAGQLGVYVERPL